jgi:hypothetical protein
VRGLLKSSYRAAMPFKLTAAGISRLRRRDF